MAQCKTYKNKVPKNLSHRDYSEEVMKLCKKPALKPLSPTRRHKTGVEGLVLEPAVGRPMPSGYYWLWPLDTHRINRRMAQNVEHTDKTNFSCGRHTYDVPPTQLGRAVPKPQRLPVTTYRCHYDNQPTLELPEIAKKPNEELVKDFKRKHFHLGYGILPQVLPKIYDMEELPTMAHKPAYMSTFRDLNNVDRPPPTDLMDERDIGRRAKIRQDKINSRKKRSKAPVVLD